MPLVAVRPQSGNSYTILMEKCQGVDYAKISLVLEGLTSTGQRNDDNLDKTCVRMLLSLANSDRERQSLRYAIFKASGMSQTEARCKFGFESMSKRAEKVEQVLEETETIREAIDDLARTQDKVLLETMGIAGEVSSDEESNESDTEECTEPSQDVSCEILKTSLESSNFNWFECIDQLESQCSGETASKFTETFLENLPALNLKKEQELLAVNSYHAFLAAKCDVYEEERLARMLNGEVVTDSEADNPDDYVELNNVVNESSRKLIAKRRKAIKRRAQRERAKAFAERRFLTRKTSKRVSKIMKECPDIGKTIEKFVEERKVGADAWRRTGVLTFDGNTRLKEKVTYERIRQHVQHVYHRNFAYGTVVQLCIARNKRRLSAKRYKSVAMITTRHACKGFCLR